jgi:hypothetical protein
MGLPPQLRELSAIEERTKRSSPTRRTREGRAEVRLLTFASGDGQGPEGKSGQGTGGRFGDCARIGGCGDVEGGYGIGLVPGETREGGAGELGEAAALKGALEETKPNGEKGGGDCRAKRNGCNADPEATAASDVNQNTDGEFERGGAGNAEIRYPGRGSKKGSPNAVKLRSKSPS